MNWIKRYWTYIVTAGVTLVSVGAIALLYIFGQRDKARQLAGELAVLRAKQQITEIGFKRQKNVEKLKANARKAQELDTKLVKLQQEAAVKALGSAAWTTENGQEKPIRELTADELADAFRTLN